MKKSLLLIIAFVITNIVIGQTFVISNNPTFDSVKVVPSNPTINDSIKLIVYISNESTVRQFISFQNDSLHYTVNNDTIVLTEYSYELSSNPTLNFIDTISIGKLNVGQFILVLRNQLNIVWGGPEPTEIHFIDSVLLNLQINLSILEGQNNENIFSLYPNPTTGKIKINGENIKNVLVFNVAGETILDLKKSNEINIAKFPKGIYFIKVLTDRFVQTKKLILQ